MLKHLTVFLFASLLIQFAANAQTNPAANTQHYQNPSHPVANPPIEPAKSHPLQDETQKHIQADVRVIDAPAKDFYDKAAFWINVALAAIGLLGIGVGASTLIFLRGQVSEMRLQREAMGRQADLMEKQLGEMKTSGEIARESADAALKQIQIMTEKERARLTFIPIPLEEIELDTPWIDVEAAIVNLGPTNAFKVWIKYRAEITDNADDPLPEGNWDITSLELIPPSGDAPKVKLEFSVTEELNEKFKCLGPTELVLHLSGEVAYEDIFRNPHRIAFQQMYKLTRFWKITERNGIQFVLISEVAKARGWRKCRHPEHNTND